MNLKTAARRLGVHYQTAYRWVRSGELVAVKVGSGYEISEAALERFQAQREVLEQVPDLVLRPATPAEARGAALDVLDAMLARLTVDAGAVADRAALALAEVVGDASTVRVDAGDREIVASHHHDPQLDVLTATLVRYGSTGEGSFLEQARCLGEPVLVPQVSQRDVRPMVRPEFHQFLGPWGFYSSIAAPVVVGGETLGAVLVARDSPGRPLTTDDLAYVVRVAERVAAAVARARLARDAWEVRRRILGEIEGRRDAGASFRRWSEDPQAFLRDVADEADAVAMVGVDGRVLAATGAFGGLLGDGARDDLAGRALSDVVTWDDGGPATQRLLRGEIDFFSVVEQRRFEPRVPIAAHVAVVRLPDATPCCTIVVAHAVPEVREPN